MNKPSCEGDGDVQDFADASGRQEACSLVQTLLHRTDWLGLRSHVLNMIMRIIVCGLLRLHKEGR